MLLRVVLPVAALLLMTVLLPPTASAAPAGLYACAPDYGCTFVPLYSFGDRVPNLKFNATSYHMPALSHGSLNATGLKLQFDLVDSKTNKTFTWVTYNLTISRIDGNGRGKEGKVIIVDYFQSEDGPLTLDIRQGTRPVTITNATQDPFTNAWSPIPNSNDTISITSSELLQEGTYKASAKIVTIDNPRNIFPVNQTRQFDVEWTINNNGIATVPEFSESLLALGAASLLVVFMLARRHLAMYKTTRNS